MIYCPICGTNNRHGSKFCNECGTELRERGQIRCPACGKMNPTGAAACDSCGEELAAPVIPIPPGSGFMVPDQEEAAGATQLPLWYQSLPAEMTAEIRESTGAGEESEGPRVIAAAQALDGEAVAGNEAAAAPPASEAETAHPVLAREDQARIAASGEEGPEAGIEEGLPAASTLAQPRPATATPRSQEEEELRDSGSWSSQAQLFAEIVSAPPKVALAETSRPGTPWLKSLPRWILSALLLAAVTIPLLIRRPLLSSVQEWLPPGWNVGTGSMEATPAVAALYDQISSLESDAPVLLAIDYDPTAMEEMDPLARAILRHLVESRARVVTVSLLPAGAGMAQELLDTIHAGSGGQRYVNLGYLAGQAAGVRLLGESVPMALPTDFSGNRISDLEGLEGISALRDFDLIVELAASPDTLRWWIEQGSTPQEVPLAAGVSAAVEPLARPYYETNPRQVEGLAGGVRGAAMYEILLSDQVQGSDLQQNVEGPEARRLDAQLAGQLVLILAILVGTVVYLAHRVAERVRG
jgi:hypothetical protein